MNSGGMRPAFSVSQLAERKDVAAWRTTAAAVDMEKGLGEKRKGGEEGSGGEQSRKGPTTTKKTHGTIWPRERWP